MSAVVIIMPGNASEPRSSLDWREQRTREKLARLKEERHEPPRTRPMLVDLEKYSK